MDKPISHIKVTQVKSQIKRPEVQKRTLKALGLGRIGKSNTLPANPAVRGMIHKVQHLIHQQNLTA